MFLEPSRLAPRYARNARFLLSMVARDLMQGVAECLSRSRARLPCHTNRAEVIPHGVAMTAASGSTRGRAS